MSMSITVENLTPFAESGAWCGELAPSIVQRLGKANNAKGENSVLLIDAPQYRAAERELRFRLENTTVLNVGTTSRTYFLSTAQGENTTTVQEGNAPPEATAEKSGLLGGYGPGDREFLISLGEVSAPVKEAGRELLSRVRKKYPGDLRPYEHRRFINSPDNFWGVQIQNRNQMLKISVRGIPERLPTTGLRVWLDRPPVYSAFKIEHVSQLDDAMRIIDHADRK